MWCNNKMAEISFVLDDAFITSTGVGWKQIENVKLHCTV